MEIEPKLEDIYSKIREKRILLGHPTDFIAKKHSKTRNNTSRELLISESGGVMYM